MNARHQSIIELLSERGSVSVSELALTTGVSEVTMRQDLNQLEKEGLLRRVHGSAVAAGGDDVGVRMQTRFAVKKSLADYAASLVNEGETVFIEGGSTNALLAQALSERHDVTLVTVSHYIAGLLREKGGDVIILGGLFQKSSESVVGPLTRLFSSSTFTKFLSALMAGIALPALPDATCCAAMSSTRCWKSPRIPLH